MNARTARVGALEDAQRRAIAERRRELAEMTPEQYDAQIGTLSAAEFESLKRSLWTPEWIAAFEAMTPEELAEAQAGRWPERIPHPRTPNDGVTL